METLTDIVFEKRNKAYGAYVLRREYRTVLLISVLITITLLLSAFAYPLLASYKSKALPVHEKTDISVTVNTGEKPVVPTPPAVEPALPKVKFSFKPPVVVDGDIESGMITQQELGTGTTTSEPAPMAIEPTTETTASKQVIETTTEQPPELWVSEMPVFTGGEAEMSRYIASRIRYPSEAREIGIHGTVFIEFIVEANGSISHVTVKRGIGGGCDEEAVKVVTSMPKWNPGKQNGQAVRVLLTLPVRFILN